MKKGGRKAEEERENKSKKQLRVFLHGLHGEGLFAEQPKAMWTNH